MSEAATGLSDDARDGGGEAENSEDHMKVDSPWLTADEGAQRGRVGTKTIYREVKAGRLRAARVGGRRELRFRAEWVDEWLDARSTPVIVSEL